MNEVEPAYDLSHEMRRFVLSKDFEDASPQHRQKVVEALSKGHRIWFAPDDEELYVERRFDRIFRDSRKGDAVGGQRL